MKKVLIMGGAGFIGFNIAKFLQQKEGYQITIADNLSRGKMDNFLSDFIKNENVNFI